MKDYRTKSEIELHALVLDLMDALTKPKMNREKFPQLMGSLRDIKVRLDNLQRGCLTGLHASECLCAKGMVRTVSCESKRRAA